MPFEDESRILVPVDVSAAEHPDSGIVSLLRPTHVVLLGYYPVPDQSAPAMVKSESGAEAEERLATIAAEFEDGGAAVEEVLVFTHDRQDSINRVAEEHECDAVLTAGRAGDIERILVPLRGETNLERIVTLVAALERTGDERVTLFHTVSTDDDSGTGEFLLRGAADRLREEGIDADRIDWELDESGDPEGSIVAAAPAYDLVVLGETEPSLRQRILGEVPGRIVDAIDVPALIVRDLQ